MNGFITLFIYFALMMILTLIFTKLERNKERFFVADRKVGAGLSAMGIAATWVWAPSLFVSAERAYFSGLAGLFWFLVPNILCLLIFIPFAKRIRAELPAGITLSGYMNQKYSNRVKNIYLVELLGLATMSTVVQLVAGGKMLSSVMGIPYPIITVILAAIAFSYSQYSGYKSSLVANTFQFTLILGICFLLVGGTIFLKGGQSYVDGLGGISGNYNSLFSTGSKEVFWSFGLSATIGLLSGPFGDQTFWQSAFSIKKDKIRKSFALGAVLFALVPLSMSALGFVAAGTGFIPTDGSMVNFQFAQSLFPGWVIWLFVFMLLSGLLSTVGSNLCAVPALIDDIKPANVRQSKMTMLIYLFVAILIANIPGLTVTNLFLIYGTLRASTMLTTVLTLKGVKLTEKGVFYGVIGSMVFGLPTFIVGSLMNVIAMKVAGSLIALLTSGGIALIISKWEVAKSGNLA